MPQVPTDPCADADLFSVETLVRSVAASRPCRHMLLLGAGCSVTSNVLSAYGCMWSWKRQMYLSANPELSSEAVADVGLPSVQARIQEWCDAQSGFPPAGAEAEYSFYAERCYPIAQDRRKFFEHLLLQARPGIGYTLLGLLVAAGHFRWIWTTNFDDLVERAVPACGRRVLRVYGSDTTHRLERVEEDDAALHIVKLHGDYRYDALRNTAAELQTLDADFRDGLKRKCQSFPLVVLGYSGRDDNVLSALRSAFGQPGHSALYWVLLRGMAADHRVTELLHLARASGHQAHLVESDGFDRVLIPLARVVFDGTPESSQVDTILRSRRAPQPKFQMVAVNPTGSVLKSNAWPVTLPGSLTSAPARSGVTYESVGLAVGKSNGRVVAGVHSQRIIAFGTTAEIRASLSDQIAGEVQCSPVPVPGDRGWSVALHVLRDALVQALRPREYDLGRSGRRWYVFSRKSQLSTAVGSLRLTYFLAAQLRLEVRAEKIFLFVTPDLYFPPGSDWSEDTKRAVAVTKARLLGKQWNKPFNDALKHWADVLGIVRDSRTVTFPSDEVAGTRFTVGPGPVFTPILSVCPPPNAVARPARARELYGAFLVREPLLRFATGEDTHPIRGLLAHGPYDPLRGVPAPAGLRLGVICPKQLSASASRFLSRLQCANPQIETKQEYLVPYPGFERAFRLRLDVPSPRTPGWVELQNSLPSDPVQAFQVVTKQITSALSQMEAGPGVDVTVVVVPSSWNAFTSISINGRCLDLHDHIKAVAALRGLRTQLVREETFRKGHLTEIFWWLALALYVKSYRTPWVVANERKLVTHIGIGFSVDRANPDAPIAIGCSHVYQADGVGVRFQLSQLQNPSFDARRNPYLSREDAVGFGLSARQMVFEALGAPPERVCITKRTPFRQCEIDGLSTGFGSTVQLDLITIEDEPCWRYLASAPGGGQADPYPVRRGTVVLMTDGSFLLWLHGRVEGVSAAGNPYFLGKSRIPAPVRVTRYGGNTSLEETARQLLALSKMDWNSFDFYKRSPAELSSAERIARVARDLKGLQGRTLDYRVLM